MRLDQSFGAAALLVDRCSVLGALRGGGHQHPRSAQPQSKTPRTVCARQLPPAAICKTDLAMSSGASMPFILAHSPVGTLPITIWVLWSCHVFVTPPSRCASADRLSAEPVTKDQPGRAPNLSANAFRAGGVSCSGSTLMLTIEIERPTRSPSKSWTSARFWVSGEHASVHCV